MLHVLIVIASTLQYCIFICIFIFYTMMMVNIDVQYLQRSLVLLVTSASDLTMCLTINFVVLHKQDSQMRGAASFVSRDQQTPPLSAETYTPPLKC